MKQRSQNLSRDCLNNIASAILLVMLCASTSLAKVEYELNPSYSVGNIKVYEPKPTSAQIAAGKLGVSATGGGCGDIANVMGVLGLNLNESSLQNLVSNWKGMALPLALYLLSSYLPQAKEALMGARTLSQFVASLGGASCEAAMKQVERMSLADSKLVTECMNARLGDIKGKSQSEINAAYEACIKNPGTMSLIKALGGDPEKIGKYVSFLDPQSFARCAAKNAGIKDLSAASYEDLKNASFGDKLANIAILLMPTVDVSLEDGGLKYSTLKIGGKDISFMEYIGMVRADIEKDIDELIKNIAATENGQEILEHVNKFGNKHNLDLSGVKLLFELVAQWGKRIDAQTGDKILSDRVAVCKGKYEAVKKRHLKDAIFRKALTAIKIELLIKMNTIEQSAAKAAAMGGAYGCKDADDKKVSMETVESMARAKDNAIALIDSVLGGLAPEETACKAIGESLRECFNANMDGTIRIENDEGEPTLWHVGDDCSVFKIGVDKTGKDENIDTPTPLPKGAPKTFAFRFSKGEFALIGLIFLGLAIVYFGVLVVKAVSREEWAAVSINGVVVLVLIGIMFQLLQ